MVVTSLEPLGSVVVVVMAASVVDAGNAAAVEVVARAVLVVVEGALASIPVEVRGSAVVVVADAPPPWLWLLRVGWHGYPLDQWLWLLRGSWHCYPRWLWLKVGWHCHHLRVALRWWW